MANIIDLEFYRKFKIILPLKRKEEQKNKPFGESRLGVKRYRRRQKPNPHSGAKKKE